MLQIYNIFLICKLNHHFLLCPIENSMRLSSAMQAPSCGWLPKVGIFAHLPGCLSRQTLPRQTHPRPLPVSEGSSMLQFLRVITPLHHREGPGGGSECQPKIRPTCFYPCRLHLADGFHHMFVLFTCQLGNFERRHGLLCETSTSPLCSPK